MKKTKKIKISIGKDIVVLFTRKAGIHKSKKEKKTKKSTRDWIYEEF